VTREQLRLIYQLDRKAVIQIGHLQQDPTIPAGVDIDEMVSKHFAILGTTGVGKSSAVALVLDEILQAKPDLRIFLLDCHNEYGRCFGSRSYVLNPRNLRLPFWLFNFEEFVDVIFRGRPGVDAEVEILSELIPAAKNAYVQEQRSLRRNNGKGFGYTVDTPVPYRLADLIGLIDEQMGKLENRSSRMDYFRLLSRLDTVRNDPRYMFMFENANVGGDTMAETLAQLFRLPANGMPMTVMQLAGFPHEVVDAVVSVVGRMAFDFGLWSDGSAPILFVCEESHRYASADRSIGFGPTRKALSRIAKEGRKYGVYLGLITQRPGELDSTILSQCSTMFAMRLANEKDQALLRAAVSDAGANLLGYVSSLGIGEVLAFGEGLALPTLMRFRHLPAEKRPSGEAVASSRLGLEDDPGSAFIETVIDRWRGASTATPRQRSDEDFGEFKENEIGASVGAEFSALNAPTLAPAAAATPSFGRQDAGFGRQTAGSSIRKVAQIETPRVKEAAPAPSSGGSSARAAFGRFIP
jgi:DNA helicase HerA-like ATPase